MTGALRGKYAKCNCSNLSAAYAITTVNQSAFIYYITSIHLS